MAAESFQNGGAIVIVFDDPPFSQPLGVEFDFDPVPEINEGSVARMFFLL